MIPLTRREREWLLAMPKWSKDASGKVIEEKIDLLEAEVDRWKKIASEEHEAKVEWEELYVSARERIAELEKELDRLRLVFYPGSRDDHDHAITESCWAGCPAQR